jgi:hypothetical protein
LAVALPSAKLASLTALEGYAPEAYSLALLTVVETLLFQKQWPLYWTEEERGAFAAYIAERPAAGDVVPESGGIRKVRGGRAGSGKSGGVRVSTSLAPLKVSCPAHAVCQSQDRQPHWPQAEGDSPALEE